MSLHLFVPEESSARAQPHDRSKNQHLVLVGGRRGLYLLVSAASACESLVHDRESVLDDFGERLVRPDDERDELVSADECAAVVSRHFLALVALDD